MTELAQWRLVAVKELRDALGRLGAKPLIRTAGVVVLFGLLVPLRVSELAYLPALVALFMAFLPARLLAVEALAGERERGTLEPLLATPLSDRAIAAGKITAATVYGAARSWLFLAAWLPAALALRAAGAEIALPSAEVLAAVVAGGALVAYTAGVFGVWQSAGATSVRAIVESGGALRLAIIVGVFFVAPWLLGLLGPAGAGVRVDLPGSGAVALPSLAGLVEAYPVGSVVIAAALAAGFGAWLAWLTRATVQRCRRERLALVDSTPGGGQ